MSGGIDCSDDKGFDHGGSGSDGYKTADSAEGSPSRSVSPGPVTVADRVRLGLSPIVPKAAVPGTGDGPKADASPAPQENTSSVPQLPQTAPALTPGWGNYIPGLFSASWRPGITPEQATAELPINTKAPRASSVDRAPWRKTPYGADQPERDRMRARSPWGHRPQTLPSESSQQRSTYTASDDSKAMALTFPGIMSS